MDRERKNERDARHGTGAARPKNDRLPDLGDASGPSDALAHTSGAPDTTAKETGTLRRVLMLLQCLADHPGESAQRMAQRLNLPRSSVHRLLAMLRDDDFAANDPDGTFTPGPALFRIAGKLQTQMPMARLAGPYLNALTEQFQETTLLTLLERHHLKMFHAASGAPANPMRYNVALNALEPILWGATGRTLMAYLQEHEIAAAIRRNEPSPVGATHVDESELRAALAQIRSDGYAITHGHRTANAVGVAVPFFDSHGEVVGSVGFLIPEFRWNEATEGPVLAALRDAAAAISGHLGGVLR